MRRLVGLSFIGTMLLVATSTVATAATSPNVTVTKTVKVKAAWISPKYPKSWILVPLTKKGLVARAKIMSKKNPELVATAPTSATSSPKFLT